MYGLVSIESAAATISWTTARALAGAVALPDESIVAVAPGVVVGVVVGLVTVFGLDSTLATSWRSKRESAYVKTSLSATSFALCHETTLDLVDGPKSPSTLVG